MTRARRRLSAWVALLGFCFVQTAAAAHACGAMFAQLAPAAAASDIEAPCEHMGAPDSPARTGLCIEHCQAGSHAVDSHAPVVGADTPVVLAAFRIPTLDADDADVPADVVTPRATAPPVFASSHRLRI